MKYEIGDYIFINIKLIEKNNIRDSEVNAVNGKVTTTMPTPDDNRGLIVDILQKSDAIIYPYQIKLYDFENKHFFDEQNQICVCDDEIIGKMSKKDIDDYFIEIEASKYNI